MVVCSSYSRTESSKESIPRLILNQFRWLDSIEDSKRLINKLLQILEVCPPGMVVMIRLSYLSVYCMLFYFSLISRSSKRYYIGPSWNNRRFWTWCTLINTNLDPIDTRKTFPPLTLVLLFSNRILWQHCLTWWVPIANVLQYQC